MAKRRIIVYNTLARDASRSEAEKKVQAASREQLYAALKDTRTDPTVRKMVEKELDYRANHGRDVVGNKEDIAYGYGYHTGGRASSNPYTGPEAVAWEKGRKAAKLAGKLRKNEYMSGEYGPTGAGMKRNIQFQQPRVRDTGMFSIWVRKKDRTTPLTREEKNRGLSPDWAKLSRTVAWFATRTKAEQAAREFAVKYPQLEYKVEEDQSQRDFRSERGYVAKILGPQGQIWQKSEPRISPAGAQNWAKVEAEKYAKQGKRVTIQVEAIMFDPEREYA